MSLAPLLAKFLRRSNPFQACLACPSCQQTQCPSELLHSRSHFLRTLVWLGVATFEKQEAPRFDTTATHPPDSKLPGNGLRDSFHPPTRHLDKPRPRLKGYKSAVFLHWFERAQTFTIRLNFSYPPLPNNMNIYAKCSLVVGAGILTGGVAFYAAPAIAACLGGLGVLGTASTGASILALEGAALTSASLASLGGGALTVGGGGMAAGMTTIATTGAVVGGLSTGAVVACG